MMLSNSLQRRLPVQNNLYSNHPAYVQDQRQAVVYNGIGNGTLNRRNLVQEPTLNISTRNESPISPNNHDLSASDYLPPPAMGPLRSISQELNNYAPAIYTAHQQRYNQNQGASLRHNGSIRRYSPSHQPSTALSPRLPTMVHYHQQQNGKSAPPYAEVRPVVMNSHPKPSGNGAVTTITSCNTNNGGTVYCNGNTLYNGNNNNLKISPNSQQNSPVLSTFTTTTTTTPSCNNNGNNMQNNYCSVAKQQSTVRPDYMDLVDCLPGDLV
uniref:Uncharacterized protein n=1 Tax=Romanomermis culicivorax TaxID=13658 RepID=A0A915KIJ9_ROMCU